MVGAGHQFPGSSPLVRYPQPLSRNQPTWDPGTRRNHEFPCQLLGHLRLLKMKGALCKNNAYRLGVTPPSSISGKWRFLGIPEPKHVIQKKYPGGHERAIASWEGGWRPNFWTWQPCFDWEVYLKFDRIKVVKPWNILTNGFQSECWHIIISVSVLPSCSH